MSDGLDFWRLINNPNKDYKTLVQYDGNGSTTSFEFNFSGGYLEKEHIYCALLSLQTGEVDFVNFNWVGSYRIRLEVPPTKNQRVIIFRDTPKATPIAKFIDGAVINERNLDRNAQQAIFAVAEMVDRFDNTFEKSQEALEAALGVESIALEAKEVAYKSLENTEGFNAKADKALKLSIEAKDTADGISGKADDALSLSREANTLVKSTGVVGSFEHGLTGVSALESNKQYVSFQGEGVRYFFYWSGILPKEVKAGDSPLNDGIGPGKWIPIGDYGVGKHVGNILPFMSDTEYDVFLVYGQSNAVGYAPTEGKEDYPKLIDNAKELWFNPNTKELKPIIKELVYSSGDVSTGHAWASFANRYVQLTGRGCIILPAAKGGTPLINLLKGNSSGIYSKMTDMYRDFVTYTKDNKLRIGSVNVLFHQGETDQTALNTREFYIKRLNILIDDMVTDFNVKKFFIAKVGNPQSRLEVSWSDIQLAQEDVCAKNPVAVMSYRGCGSFTKTNLLLSTGDGVHYTQSGYNLMGYNMGESVASSLYINSRVSAISLVNYGCMQLPNDQQWVQFAGTARYDSDGGWVLLHKDNSYGDPAFRVSNIRSINASTRFVSFKLAYEPTDLLHCTSSVNDVGTSNGLSTYWRMRSVTGSDGYTTPWCDVYLLQTLNFFVDGNTGAITRYPTGGTTQEYITKQVTSKVDKDNNTLTLNFPDIKSGMPRVQSLSRDNLNSNPRIMGITSNSITISFDSTDRYRLLAVEVPNCLVNPLYTTISGVQVQCHGVSGFRRR